MILKNTCSAAVIFLSTAATAQTGTPLYAKCIFGDTLVGGCPGYFDGTMCVPEGLTAEQAQALVKQFITSPEKRRLLGSFGRTVRDLENTLLLCRMIAGSMR
jgi:hypothetical protein